MVWTELKGSGHYKLLSKVDKLITSMMAFVSLNRESISREQGWILLDAGRKQNKASCLSACCNQPWYLSRMNR